MTSSEAEGIVAGLAALFKQDLDPATQDLYARYIADLPVELAKEAFAKIVATSTFFPAIAEFRRAAASLDRPYPTPEEAWEEVNVAIRRYGRYGVPRSAEEGFGWDEVVWSCRPLALTVRTIGYDYLCEGENEAADRAHFFRIFESYVQRALEDVQVAPLLHAPAVGERREIGRGQVWQIADGTTFRVLSVGAVMHSPWVTARMESADGKATEVSRELSHFEALLERHQGVLMNAVPALPPSRTVDEAAPAPPPEARRLASGLAAGKALPVLGVVR